MDCQHCVYCQQHYSLGVNPEKDVQHFATLIRSAYSARLAMRKRCHYLRPRDNPREFAKRKWYGGCATPAIIPLIAPAVSVETLEADAAGGGGGWFRSRLWDWCPAAGLRTAAAQLKAMSIPMRIARFAARLFISTAHSITAVSSSTISAGLGLSILAPAIPANRAGRRAAPSRKIRRGEPAWRLEGGHPLLSLKIQKNSGRSVITGDFHDEFLELYLPENETVDPGSPVLVREQAGKSDLFEITFLCSDPSGTQSRKTIAYCVRIARLGAEIILKAARNDPTASNQIGQFILWQLDDPVCARPYLEQAAKGGIGDALFDLAAIELFLHGTYLR